MDGWDSYCDMGQLLRHIASHIERIAVLPHCSIPFDRLWAAVPYSGRLICPEGSDGCTH
jgi:hypothetical protein